jgi:hypothetical protein
VDFGAPGVQTHLRTVYQFDPFEVNVASGELLKNGHIAVEDQNLIIRALTGSESTATFLLIAVRRLKALSLRHFRSLQAR